MLFPINDQNAFIAQFFRGNEAMAYFVFEP
jgi:hypothetical protein